MEKITGLVGFVERDAHGKRTHFEYRNALQLARLFGTGRTSKEKIEIRLDTSSHEPHLSSHKLYDVEQVQLEQVDRLFQIDGVDDDLDELEEHTGRP
jgi:hypothetical protein